MAVYSQCDSRVTVAKLFLHHSRGCTVCEQGTGWHVFTVDAKIKFVNGFADPRGGEEVRFVVELTNRGKTTSLKNWSAQLINTNRQVFDGEPLTIVGQSVDSVGSRRVEEWESAHPFGEEWAAV